MKKNIKLVIFYITVFIIITLVAGILSVIIDKLLCNNVDVFINNQFNVNFIINDLKNNEKTLNLFKLIEILFISLAVYYFSIRRNGKEHTSQVREVAKGIVIPKAVGQGQYGTSDFMNKQEMNKVFQSHILDPKEEHIKSLMEHKETEPFLKGAGLVVNYEKHWKKEKIYYIKGDVHTNTIGSTRCGKTRGEVLQTAGLMGLAGQSVIFSDLKGELYDFTSEYYKNLGYEVKTLDFKNPKKSDHYNFLQTCIDAMNDDDIALTVDRIWDITSSLVGEPKGEKLWSNGEASTIASSIMSVIYENTKNYNHQNFTNVYHFINNMCKSDAEGNMPLSKYLKTLDDSHPAKALFGTAEIAPERTRGSFFTSALNTLRLFTTDYVAQITKESDFKLSDIANKKFALYIIIPDEKKTYCSIASLLTYLIYLELVKVADSTENGGRLPRNVNFILDEFGNFPQIPRI